MHSTSPQSERRVGACPGPLRARASLAPAVFAEHIRHKTATWAGIVKARKIAAQ